MGCSVIEYAIIEHTVYTITCVVKAKGRMSEQTVYLVVRRAGDETDLNAVQLTQVVLGRDVVAGEKTD